MLRLAESPAFVAAMAVQQDYEASVLLKAHKILTEKSLGEYAHAARLQALIQQVRSQGVAPDGMLGPAVAPVLLQPKLPFHAAWAGTSWHANSVPGSAMAAVLLQTRWASKAESRSQFRSAY